MTTTSVIRMTRARSSRKWSPSDIRPPSPMGSRGRPRNSSMTPPTDTAGGLSSSDGAGRLGVFHVGPDLVLALRGGPVALVDLALLGSRVLVIFIEQALGLGLEDPEGTTAAPRQLGELLRTEQQHQDADDDQQLRHAEAANDVGEEPRGHAVMLRRMPEPGTGHPRTGGSIWP